MFNIFKPELIQFGDGKFAIRKNRIFHYLYMDKTGYWWMTELPKFDTHEEALEAYTNTQFKVISKLDDEWEL